MDSTATRTETAVFGGGCFWCTEAVFESLNGVISVMPGYAGGETKNPTYEQVCTGKTGHAEVIRIEFDPSRIAFRDLLTVFFGTHDPTTLNRQGNDVGTQYRSVILCSSEEQKRESEAFLGELSASGQYQRPIVTQIQPLDIFYPAEGYHHKYFRRNTGQPYCQIVIQPKLVKVQKQFADLLKLHGADE